MGCPTCQVRCRIKTTSSFIDSNHTMARAEQRLNHTTRVGGLLHPTVNARLAYSTRQGSRSAHILGAAVRCGPNISGRLVETPNPRTSSPNAVPNQAAHREHRVLIFTCDLHLCISHHMIEIWRLTHAWKKIRPLALGAPIRVPPNPFRRRSSTRNERAQRIPQDSDDLISGPKME
ncbi:hypothetical protein BU23DRAFT_332523 [Bimuria novae-zelandiae CBS 107.79]|uniref:Uncharacterized protein n=1 Tax=Bimuria novae-zelandiae CBS 107.79 TaxID=1447943 RepID=A0A6A5UTG3_9PLEO|nr:hypothetical protein BU23DRAFT_332523 [Bimuria novae-zelandiae CBS 107.79]